MYDIYCDFDIKKHKETYTNYLEVIILSTGKVVYAVPSHLEKLIKIAMEKYNCSREKVNEMCPKEMWFDFMTWLCNITDCVAVWNYGIRGKPNRFQKHKLIELKNNGLYKGEI